MKAIIVGTAHPHAAMYQQTLRQMHDVDFVGIVHDGGTIAPPFDALPTFASVDDVLHRAARDETFTFHMAFVFLPANQVVIPLTRLIDAGKHVFCEKPVTRKSADLAPLLALAEQKGVVFGAGYQWRVHPVARWIKAQIDEGYLGRLQHAEARMITSTVASRGSDHYLFQKDRGGGGITHWLGCHHIDLLRYFTGAEVAAVSAMTATVSDAPVDVEDVSMVHLRFTDGCLAGLQQGYLLPAESDDPFGGSPYDMFIAVRGSKGWIRWDPSTTEVEMYSTVFKQDGAPVRRLAFDLAQRDGYGGVVGYNFILHFIDAAKRGESPPSTATDALETLRIIEAAYESSAQGRVVVLR